MYRYLLIWAWAIAPIPVQAQENRVHVIPEPAEIIPRTDSFLLSAQTALVCAAEDSLFYPFLLRFIDRLERRYGIRLKLYDQIPQGQSSLVHCFRSEQRPPEGYGLDLDCHAILIDAGDQGGIAYALTSLEQLLVVSGRMAAADRGIRIPCVSIVDYPRFAHRGMQLDAASRYISPPLIHRYLELLTRYKFNILYWKLSARYRDSNTGPEQDLNTALLFDGPGKYGSGEITDLLQHAEQLKITVIPQLSLSDLSAALTEAYPDLACEPAQELSGADRRRPLFCAGNESLHRLLSGWITDFMGPFSAAYLALDAGAFPYSSWQACKVCRDRMDREGLSGPEELLGTLLRRLQGLLDAGGRQLILSGISATPAHAPGMILLSEEGEQALHAGIKSGHRVIAAPLDFTRLDDLQSLADTGQPRAEGYLPLNRTYAFFPEPEKLSLNERQLLMGISGWLSTRYLDSADDLFRQLLPRLTALSEAAWSNPACRDFCTYIDKLECHLESWAAEGVPHSRALYHLELSSCPDPSGRGLAIRIRDQLGGKHLIRYRTDGADPDADSPIYAGPLSFSRSGALRAAVFRHKERLGPVLSDSVFVHAGVGACILSPGYGKGEEEDSGFMILTDGLRGGKLSFDDRWVRLPGRSFSFTLDLGKPIRVYRVQAGVLAGGQAQRSLEDKYSLWRVYLQAAEEWPVSVESRPGNPGPVLTGLSDTQRITMEWRGFENPVRYLQFRVEQVRRSGMEAVTGQRQRPGLCVDEIIVDSAP